MFYYFPFSSDKPISDRRTDRRIAIDDGAIYRRAPPITTIHWLLSIICLHHKPLQRIDQHCHHYYCACTSVVCWADYCSLSRISSQIKMPRWRRRLVDDDNNNNNNNKTLESSTCHLASSWWRFRITQAMTEIRTFCVSLLRSVSTTRVHGPSWRVSKNAPEFSGRQLGPWTRPVNSGNGNRP